jgi:hypothetical protein
VPAAGRIVHESRIGGSRRPVALAALEVRRKFGQASIAR